MSDPAEVTPDARNASGPGGRVHHPDKGYDILARVFRENGPRYYKTYALVIACLLLIAAATAFTAWIMKDVIDRIYFERRIDLIAVIALSIMGAFTIRGAASYVQAILTGRIGNEMVAHYQRRIFRKLMALGFDFHKSERSAALTSRIGQNISGIRDVMSMTVTAMARDAVTLVALIVVMVIQEPLLSVTIAVIGPPLLLTVNYVMRRVRAITRETVHINARLFGAMQETVQGMAIVKAFTMEEALNEKLDGLVARSEERANKILSVSERTGPVAEVLAGFAVALVVAWGGYRALTMGVPPGATFSFITALLLAYDPARRLARLQVQLEKALVNARMIYELLDIEPPQSDGADRKPFRPDGGEIRFDNVRFAYEEGRTVLDGVTFTAARGRTLAIVGPSGAGKSTIVALVLGFHEPQSGRVLIDGQDVRDVDHGSLRGSIAYVSQQPYLFEGTVRDNIRYGRPGATDAEVETAARLAQADEFITAMPQGYETPLGENGSSVSGGQRQRLSIARAILRDAPILLLDEATSALDTGSERKVQAALDGLMRDRTTIVIAHRLSTIEKADKIIVMDQGRVAETGTHKALLARKEGVYARLNAGGGGKDTLKA
jgi:ATP-binding cassette, subfamily B, bacterial MsbA